MGARANRKLARLSDVDASVPRSTPEPRRAPTLEAIDGEMVGQIPALDGLIHERARLAIVTALASGESRTHTELRDLLQLTDGNLSVHARKLEDAGYLVCTKEFAGRTPRTSYRLTAEGRQAFDRYLAHLEQLVTTMRRL